MNDLIRIGLLLAVAGAAVTALGSVMARRKGEVQRLTRVIQQALGGEPDDQIIAKGRNAAAAIRMEPPQVLVLTEGGAKARLYGLHLLVGAELEVDGAVVARAYRGEPRRALDHVAADAQEVHLRLIFDDPRHPDFTLELWGEGDEDRRDASTPAAEIREARRWLSRAEALLRRQPTPTQMGAATPAPTQVAARPVMPDLEEPPLDEDDLDEPFQNRADAFEDDDPDDVPWNP